MRRAFAVALLLLAAPASAATVTAGAIDGVPIADRVEGAGLAPGSVARFWFRAGTGALGQPWLVPVIVVRGARPGPRLLLTAGAHGDELNGIGVIHRLAATLDPAQLSGTVTMVPGLNAPGLQQSTREWSTDWGRAQPNLNRVMPGEVGGRGIQDYAGRLWQGLFLPNADTAVDLHTQSRGTRYVVYAFASSQRTRRMAELVGPDIVKMDKGERGTIENTLTDAGIPAITLELGGPETWEEAMVARGVAGLTNLMRELKMLPGPVAPVPAATFTSNDIAAVRAPQAGWGRLLVPLGAAVTKGDAVAEMTDAFGRVTARVTAPVAGRVNSIATDPRREAGDTLMRIVWWNADPACALGC